MKNKRGSTILVETVIAIIINVIFIAILVFFIFSKSNTSSLLEEKYAKEIALILDASKPGMMISLNMADAIQTAQENLGYNIDNIVNIQNNIVTVKLSDKSGYSYSFFNNVDVSKYYLDKANNQYVFFTGDYNEPKGS